MQLEQHIFFNEIQNNIVDTDLTFVINHMKCRTLAVVYFKFHCYDMNGDEIYSVANKPVYTSKRWVVDSSYSRYIEEFSISEEVLDETNTTQIELVALNIDDNNPLYFNQCMLTDKPFTAFHKTDEAMEVAVFSLIKNGYVNLYSNSSENYLQVIRPSKKSFSSHTLTANDITVLAPHIPSEPQTDFPTNLYFEFLNQTEQTTNIALDTFKM